MTVTNLRREIDGEEQREKGTVLVVTGWLFILFGIMVILFFHPSSPRFGNVNIRNLALALGAVGVVLNLWGRRVRNAAP